MSYTTLKNQLTGNDEAKRDLHLALDETYKEQTKQLEIKAGIIDNIFEPGIDIMSEYIRARQQYLDDNEPRTRAGSNIDDTIGEWRSPVTHTYNATLSTSSNQYFGKYQAHTGKLDTWVIERWDKYKQNSTFNLALCAKYSGTNETYSDLSHTKLAQVTAAPYSLDGTGRHSLSNLKSVVSSFNTGMNWIWATTSDTGNTYHGTYSSWGINATLSNIDIAIAALSATIGFKADLRDLDSQY